MSTAAEDTKFSMQEVADATGVKVEFASGISYGVLMLTIPIGGNCVLHFRQGDDPVDREVKLYRADHPYILANVSKNKTNEKTNR